MDNSTKHTIGYFGVIGVGLFLIAWLLSLLVNKPPAPRMSDTDFSANRRSEERRRCIRNANQNALLLPRDMQRYADEARAKC